MKTGSYVNAVDICTILVNLFVFYPFNVVMKFIQSVPCSLHLPVSINDGHNKFSNAKRY